MSGKKSLVEQTLAELSQDMDEVVRLHHDPPKGVETPAKQNRSDVARMVKGLRSRTRAGTAHSGHVELLKHRLASAGAPGVASRVGKLPEKPKDKASGSHGDISLYAHRASEKAHEMGGHALGDKKGAYKSALKMDPLHAKKVRDAHKEAHDAFMVAAKAHMDKGDYGTARGMRDMALKHAEHASLFHQRYQHAKAPKAVGESIDVGEMKRLMGYVAYPSLKEAAPTLAELDEFETEIRSWQWQQRQLMGLDRPYPSLEEARGMRREGILDFAKDAVSAAKTDVKQNMATAKKILPAVGAGDVASKLGSMDKLHKALGPNEDDDGMPSIGLSKGLKSLQKSAAKNLPGGKLAAMTPLGKMQGMGDEQDEGILDYIKKHIPTPGNISREFKQGAKGFARASAGDVAGALKKKFGGGQEEAYEPSWPEMDKPKKAGSKNATLSYSVPNKGGSSLDQWMPGKKALPKQRQEAADIRQVVAKQRRKMASEDAASDSALDKLSKIRGPEGPSQTQRTGSDVLKKLAKKYGKVEASPDVPASVKNQARSIEKKGGPLDKRPGGAKSRAGIAYAISWKHYCANNPNSRHCKK